MPNNNQPLPEFTLRAFLLAIIITILLGAANAYLALKMGQTISASIPAAVLAIGILRWFKNSNILESNLVQTAASAGEGIAASISFVLPALIILNFWTHFDYWQTVAVILLGGLMGVLFSIPLRRVLLQHPVLRFPEGTAIGNVLKVSADKNTSISELLQGGLIGGLISLFQTGFKIFADSLQVWFNAAGTVAGFALGFNPAMLAAGYIIGIEVAITFFAGAMLAWIIGIPLLGLYYGLPAEGGAYDKVMFLWSHYLRYVGVGTMLVGGVWTLLGMLKPMLTGLKASMNSLSKLKSAAAVPTTEKDIPFVYVLWGTLVLSAFLLMFLVFSIRHSGLAVSTSMMDLSAVIGVLYVVIGGFLLATTCGYLTGLVGSSNNPLSGITIAAVILMCLTLLALLSHHISFATNDSQTCIAASMVLLIAAVIATLCSITNENIQDLKAGQMIGATPWKQQLMLCVGVVVSAFVVAPILELLFQAYGIGGVFPHPGMSAAHMLPAPQAGLMAAVAKGVFGQRLPWEMIGIGGLVALVGIVVSEKLKAKGLRVSVLALGLAIYLPLSVITPTMIGGMLSYVVDKKLVRRNPQASEHDLNQMRHAPLLLACGLVAGSALMGVILAIPFVLKGSADALRIFPESLDEVASVLGTLVTIWLCYWIYRTSQKQK